MNSRLLFFLFGSILLASCSTLYTHELSSPAEWETYQLESAQFFYPSEAKYRFERDDDSVVLATNRGSSFSDKVGDYFLTIYNSSPSPDCTTELTGGKEVTTQANTGGKTMWSRIDFWDEEKKFMGGENLTDAEKPLCLPGSGKLGVAYALCSQKDEKTVFICISQVTDNPNLAKQIFESFRWTK